MSSTYSTSLKLELIGTGDQSGTWGSTTNTNLGTLLEQAVAGVSGGTYVSGTYPVVNFSSDADLTLTSNNGAVDQARSAVLVATSTGSLTATRSIIAPSGGSKIYIIKNSTTGGQSIQIKYSATAGVTIANGQTTIVYGNGTTFYDGITSLSSLSIVGNATVGGTLGVTGAQTNSSTLQATTITATTQFSGPGIGLTGTASSLSIGGNASTATSASSATTANGLSGTPNITVGTVNGTTITASSQFSGPGTGLTGTASSLTVGTASTATSAAAITNSGGWSVTPSGTKLYFNYNGTNVASLDSSGNFIAIANITAYGTA